LKNFNFLKRPFVKSQILLLSAIVAVAILTPGCQLPAVPNTPPSKIDTIPSISASDPVPSQTFTLPSIIPSNNVVSSLTSIQYPPLYPEKVDIQSGSLLATTNFEFSSHKDSISTELRWDKSIGRQGKISFNDKLIEFRQIGQKTYIKGMYVQTLSDSSIVNRQYSLPVYLYEKYAPFILNGIRNAEQNSDEIIDGMECLRYQGTPDNAMKIDSLTWRFITDSSYEAKIQHLQESSALLNRIPGQADIWLGTRDHLIRQIRLSFEIPPEFKDLPDYPDYPHKYSFEIKYTDFNQPQNIVAPVVSSGEMLPGWVPLFSGPQNAVLSLSSTHNISDNDLAHLLINYEVRVYNNAFANGNSNENTAKNVRVIIYSLAPRLGEPGIEIVAKAIEKFNRFTEKKESVEKDSVDLLPYEEANFQATLEYDVKQISKDDLAKLLDNYDKPQAVIIYTSPNGEDYNAFGFDYTELERLSAPKTTETVIPTVIPPIIPPDSNTLADFELKGGLRLVFQADLSSISKDQQSNAIDAGTVIIRARLDALDIRSRLIQKLGNNRIQVDLPGYKEMDSAFENLGRKAVMEFGELVTDSKDPAIKWNNSLGSWKPATAALNGQQVELTSDYFKNDIRVDFGTFGPTLLFEWNSDGSILSREITTRLCNNNHAQLGIFFDGKPLLGADDEPIAPSVVGIIIDKGEIDGLDKNEASILSSMINAGRIAVPLSLVDQKIIPPSTTR
jgi:hypothetical protein